MVKDLSFQMDEVKENIFSRGIKTKWWHKVKTKWNYNFQFWTVICVWNKEIQNSRHLNYNLFILWLIDRFKLFTSECLNYDQLFDEFLIHLWLRETWNVTSQGFLLAASGSPLWQISPSSSLQRWQIALTSRSPDLEAWPWRRRCLTRPRRETGGMIRRRSAETGLNFPLVVTSLPILVCSLRLLIDSGYLWASYRH